MNRETCQEQLQPWRRSKAGKEEETVDPSQGWGWGKEEEPSKGRSRGTECTDTDAADLYGDGFERGRGRPRITWGELS
jgi:hypothetical protein